MFSISENRRGRPRSPHPSTFPDSLIFSNWIVHAMRLPSRRFNSQLGESSYDCERRRCFGTNSTTTFHSRQITSQRSHHRRSSRLRRRHDPGRNGHRGARVPRVRARPDGARPCVHGHQRDACRVPRGGAAGLSHWHDHRPGQAKGARHDGEHLQDRVLSRSSSKTPARLIPPALRRNRRRSSRPCRTSICQRQAAAALHGPGQS